MGRGRAALALVGLGLVGAATVLQMAVDWYQSYAYGIPMPNVVKALVIVAGLLALVATVIGFVAGRK